MGKELIQGIIYSQFDQKAGPKAVAWEPVGLPISSRNLVSMKTIQILAGEGGLVPESLAVIPFPSINSKGLVKYIEIKDLASRGLTIDSSITLLFNEADDTIFYKYIKNFESVFNELQKKIRKLEEKKTDKKKIAQEIVKFKKKVQSILGELRESEMTSQEAAAFPAVSEKSSKLTRYRYKLIVCGDPQVGKTSTVLRYTDNAFRRTYIPTVGINLSEKKVIYKDADIKFVLWDIAGQSKFQKMRNYFYKGADGLILIFDLTAPESFENIPHWYQDIHAHLDEDLKGLILANKNDLVAERKIPEAQIAELAKQLNLTFFETSALTGDNVVEAFSKIAELLYKKRVAPATKDKKIKSTKKRKKRAPKKKTTKRKTAKKKATKKRSTKKKSTIKKSITKKKSTKKKSTSAKKRRKKTAKKKEG